MNQDQNQNQEQKSFHSEVTIEPEFIFREAELNDIPALLAAYQDCMEAD